MQWSPSRMPKFNYIAGDLANEKTGIWSEIEHSRKSSIPKDDLKKFEQKRDEYIRELKKTKRDDFSDEESISKKLKLDHRTVKKILDLNHISYRSGAERTKQSHKFITSMIDPKTKNVLKTFSS